jgi:colicin import membrane protein
VPFGLTISVLLHVGILFWALIGFAASRPLKMPDEIPVEVSIISTIDLETKQKKGDSLSKIEEAAIAKGQKPTPKDAPKPKPVRAVEPPPPAASEPPPPPPEPVKVEPPPPPEPVKAPEPPPPPPPDQIAALIEKPAPVVPDGPTPDEKKQLEEKLAEQQRLEEQKRLDEQKKLEEQKRLEEQQKLAEAEALRKAEEKRKADEKKKADELAKKKLAEDKKKREDAERKKAAELTRKSKSFDQQMADLLNKVPDQPSESAGAEAPPSKPTTAKGPTAGSKTGTDNVNKAKAQEMIGAMLNSAFEQCWNKPLAGGGVAAPIVTLKWNLNPDGTLSGEPRVVQTDKSNPLADQAERAALRAVHTCAPFQLPQDHYTMWREITWKFNPNQTL